MECNFPRHFMMTVVQIFVQKNMLARKKNQSITFWLQRNFFGFCEMIFKAKLETCLMAICRL